jgi:uncharacterized protein YodC (DUF2158 family)
MAKQHKQGDVVVLKSGGPQMTVTGIESNGRVKVTWFDDKNQLQHATFEPGVLELWDQPDSLDPD